MKFTENVLPNEGRQRKLGGKEKYIHIIYGKRYEQF